MTSLAFLIPTKNRHRSLARTLILVRRALPMNGEILVCDQSPFPFLSGADVSVLHRPDVNGLPAARNVLLEATSADIICFLDDDTDLASDFGEQLIKITQMEPEYSGWGPVMETRPLYMKRLYRVAQMGAFRDPRRLQSCRKDACTRALFGCCFALRRTSAQRVGFDARIPGYALGEDLDFCLRFSEPLRFAKHLRAVHRKDGGNRADKTIRGKAKGEFLIRLAQRHGRRNPATLFHLILAAFAAASGRGDEPASAKGVFLGLAPWRW